MDREPLAKDGGFLDVAWFLHKVALGFVYLGFALVTISHPASAQSTSIFPACLKTQPPNTQCLAQMAQRFRPFLKFSKDQDKKDEW